MMNHRIGEHNVTVYRNKTPAFILQSPRIAATYPRHPATLAAALAVVLLAAASPTAGASERELEGFVTKKAATISTMHTKAKRALVNAAQDRSFAGYYLAEDDRDRHAAKQRIEEVSLSTQSRFHVEEMCLIDAAGPEVARIVGNAIAPDSELSKDESEASFFKPAFAEAPKRVYVTRPYMSPDADKWVLAYATPVVAKGEKKAILHYEHGLEVFRQAVNRGLGGDTRFLLIVAEGGYVISDSRRNPEIAKRGDAEEMAAYFQHVGDVAPGGLARVYAGIDERRTGSTRISENGIDYGVAYAVVEGGLTLIAVERR